VKTPPSANASLAEWLDYQLTVHPQEIALGLDRVGAVWQNLGAPRPAPCVITVGGTNGKGSTVALLAAILGAAGLRVGTYTSPHLERYNERIALDGVAVADAALTAAFGKIEAARGELALTYFEYGTLAAFLLLVQANLDVAVLEVGMGGRLDAVNLIDADCAVLTTVDLDHQAFLGPDREAIGREKAPIFRPGRAVIIGELDPPRSVLDYAATIGADVRRRGHDFDVAVAPDGERFVYLEGDSVWMELRRPPQLLAPVQLINAASAIAALNALGERLRIDEAAIAAGLANVRLPARLEQVAEQPATFVDVAHNPQAARALAVWLDDAKIGPVNAVFGALADKDIAAIAGALGSRIACWHIAGLDGLSPRGLDDAILAEQVSAALPAAVIQRHPDLPSALAAARSDPAARPVLAFGSFLVASAVRAAFDRA